MNWISTDTQLPQPGQVVIVSGGIAYRRLDTREWYTITAEQWPGKPIIWDVTHWMELPILPAQTGHASVTGETK